MMTFWFIISYFWWIFLIKFIVESYKKEDHIIEWNGLSPKGSNSCKGMGDELFRRGSTWWLLLFSIWLRHQACASDASKWVLSCCSPCPTMSAVCFVCGASLFWEGTVFSFNWGRPPQPHMPLLFYQIWQRPYLPHLLYYIRCSFHYQLPPKFSLSN